MEASMYGREMKFGSPDGRDEVEYTGLDFVVISKTLRVRGGQAST